MNKKLLIGVAAAGLVGAASLLPFSAFAQSSTGTSFSQRLAEKLGIEETKIDTALDAVKDEMHAERVAELKSEIQKAVVDGKLTQRQGELLGGIEENRPEPTKDRVIVNKEDMDKLTEEQRKAKFEEMRTEMDASIVKALNDKGFNTNADEIKAAHEAARDAGLKGPGGPSGRGMKQVMFFDEKID